MTCKRFILLTVHTFATDPVVRFACLSCACVAIVVHHIALRPFRDRMADVFESLSLLSLVAICTFSLAERRLTIYLREHRLPDPVKTSSALCNGLSSVSLAWFQQQCMCIFVVFAALYQALRLLYHCIRLLSYVMRCKCFFPGLSLRRFPIPSRSCLTRTLKN